MSSAPPRARRKTRCGKAARKRASQPSAVPRRDPTFAVETRLAALRASVSNAAASESDGCPAHTSAGRLSATEGMPSPARSCASRGGPPRPDDTRAHGVRAVSAELHATQGVAADHAEQPSSAACSESVWPSTKGRKAEMSSALARCHCDSQLLPRFRRERDCHWREPRSSSLPDHPPALRRVAEGVGAGVQRARYVDPEPTC